MKLILREYLSMLKESGELDLLLPDLLLNMGYSPISKAQKGVRQGGVDIAVTGIDDRGRNCLLLFVVKCGDITRSSWDSGKNSVRQSINEVLDVYIQTKILTIHKEYVKKIVLCTNGDISQAVEPNWHGFTTSNTIINEIEFEFWGGDRLAILIENHLLNEHIFSHESRSDLRKTLSLIAEPEYDLSHCHNLIMNIFLLQNKIAKFKSIKHIINAIKTTNLLLHIIYHWATSQNNISNTIIACERAILLGWQAIHKSNFCSKPKVIKEYINILHTYNKISSEYFMKLQTHYHTRDALSIHSHEPILITETVFNQIGLVATIGLYHVLLTKDTDSIQIIADALQNIIKNNPSSGSPCYDEHSIEITLALLFLYYSNKIETAKDWIANLCSRLSYCYQTKRYFPIFSDSLEDAIELEISGWEEDLSSEAMSISTIIPILSQWCCILKLENIFLLIKRLQQECLSNTNAQLWHPDDKTEEFIYKGPAQFNSGATQAPIFLPDTLGDLKNEIHELYKENHIYNAENMTCIKYFSPYILLVASRHFRTPVFPTLWQHIIIAS